MLQPITPVDWILTQATIDAELQAQSDLYLQKLKRISSKDDFVTRTKETMDKLNSELEKAKSDNNLDLVHKYEEWLKAHQGNLNLLDYEMEQNQKDCDWIVEIVSQLKWIKDGIK